MFTLKIENANGEIFELTHNTQNYAVIDVKGLTAPPTAVSTSVGGLADGSFHILSRVQQRNIVITVVLNGDIEANRQRLYKIFSLKRPCKIYFQNTNRNVQITGYVEVLEGDLFTQREQMQISIICPRPFFEDLNALYAELSGIMKNFEFPFSISTPIPFSEIVDLPLVTITNVGQVETGCIMSISFTDTVTGLRIVNSTTQEYFGINYTFQANDILTINTVSGQLGVSVVRNGVTTDLLNMVTDGSTWFKLPVGDNNFTFTLTSGSAQSVDIVFAVANLYGGV
jgi:hypothetical protein